MGILQVKEKESQTESQPPRTKWETFFPYKTLRFLIGCLIKAIRNVDVSAWWHKRKEQRRLTQ